MSKHENGYPRPAGEVTLSDVGTESEREALVEDALWLASRSGRKAFVVYESFTILAAARSS